MFRPSDAASRSLLEIALGFVGALLVLPLLFKLSIGLLKGLLSTFRALLKLSTVRRLVGDVVVMGLTALLTREDVLDAIFGRKGNKGDGLLKPKR